MPNRHTDRERLEVMFMTILMAFRPILFIGGCILLVYAMAASIVYPVITGIAMGLALALFLMVISDRFTLYTARLGAWLVTIGRR
jgi:hypothetical protein